MQHRSLARRARALLSASLVVSMTLAVGAPPASADSFGASETRVVIIGDTQLGYGERLTVEGTVRDNSASCDRLNPFPSCDFPHGRVDFYAVAGATQIYLASADLSLDVDVPINFYQTTTDPVEVCCLAVGTYDAIRGYYVPGDFDPSSDDSDTGVTIDRNGSTITLQASPTTADYGAGVEFSVHLAGYEDDPNAIQPAGFVDIYEGPTNYATIPVDANGDASWTTTSLPLGQHDFRARWGGDDRWTASTSAPEHVTVGGATTSTSISASTTSTTYGAPVTFTATVAAVDPPANAPTITGPVGFHEGLSFLGAADLNEATPNQAAFTTNELPVGSHSIFAVYTGDGVYVASSSDAITINVTKASTTTTLQSSLNPSAFGEAVTFTATVDGPGTTTVPGTVQFRAGGANIGAPQALVLGQASITIATLGGGSHSITAVYAGSDNYLASTSAALTQTVACDQLVTGSVRSLTLTPGQTTCLSGAKVTGNVTVPDGSSLSIVNSTVSGSVTVTAPTTAGAGLVAGAGGAGSVTICGSTIGGSLRVTGMAGFVLVGDLPGAACAGSWIKGSVTIARTTGGLTVADNRIGGGVTIANNTWSDTGGAELLVQANRIGGFLSAYGNAPAVTDGGRPNTVRGWVAFG